MLKAFGCTVSLKCSFDNLILCTAAGTQVLRRQIGWTEGGRWGHSQGAVHMAVARLGCKRTTVDTR